MSDRDSSIEVDEPENSNESDSSDLDDENDAQEQQLLDRARQLENDISDNKYLYDSHVELIDIFRKLTDLNSLRAAYKRFHEYFPLTPNLWLDWIKTEISLVTTPEQQKGIFKLFDEATEDYLSVDLWIEYAQYSIGASELETTRSILERGLNAAGLVCDKGSLLWDTLREIENVYISTHTEGSEEWNKQVIKLVDVFKRQLSIPLLEMENTYNEWEQWVKGLPEGLVHPKPVEYGYKKALKLLETYKPFEEQLLACKANEELYETYKNYIKTVTDPSTVICLYERAAVQLCLLPDFWWDYCNYVFNLGPLALNVCKKALRNCPWSEDLWIFKLRVLEKLEKSDDQVMECFEQGISNIAPSPGLELWLAYLEYTHRVVGSPEKLDKLFNQAIQQLGFENDAQCKVGRLFSRILGHRGDMKAARKIWSHILGKPQNKGSYALWLESINLEKQYGDANSVRNLFQKALNSVKDWPQYIMEEWLVYERHFGTLDDVMKCVQKCREASANLTENYQYQTDTTSQNQDHQNKGTKRKYNQEPNTSSKQVPPKRFREEKKEEVSKPVVRNRVPIEKNPETTVFISNLHPSIDENKLRELFPNCLKLEIVLDRKGKSRCFGYVQFKTAEEVMVALARDREPLDGRPVFISEIKTDRAEKKQVFKYATNAEKNKLFVKGLPISKTKEQVEELFKPHGARDVRLVLHRSGQPKGLAYVEFENEEQALKAIKETDQLDVDGHVISVAISAPPPKKEKAGRVTFGRREEGEEPSRHARSRLQTSLLPRSLQVKAGSSGAETKKEETNGTGGKMMKNTDFRNMLLKK
ncbi:squamous cell carcinoma antigen recognized by T-cells 3 [Sitophilus oryzae]|uniref:Squamous cell carcinoma antigen recognized by T-cells 3 n=1 Tax=Sitophilus oryzae TaxID=7048 RepID=A0A6J2XPR2_SITOR|nr:squamous cell carcinoma antigen recognized by T-cells 3 [Sitophilus oryzae]